MNKTGFRQYTVKAVLRIAYSSGSQPFWFKVPFHVFWNFLSCLLKSKRRNSIPKNKGVKCCQLRPMECTKENFDDTNNTFPTLYFEQRQWVFGYNKCPIEPKENIAQAWRKSMSKFNMDIFVSRYHILQVPPTVC